MLTQTSKLKDADPGGALSTAPVMCMGSVYKQDKFKWVLYVVLRLPCALC